MKTSEIFTELYKEHNIASIVDTIAEKCPDQIYGSIPTSETDKEARWQDVTISDFAKMVDKAAHWLTEVFGAPNKRFNEPIHYFLPMDLSSLVFLLATWKAGYKGIYCHPIAASEILISVNEAAKCNIMVFSGELPDRAKGLFASNEDMRMVAAPPLQFWLEASQPQPFPYPRMLADTKDEPLAVVHSSGSTGMPKPIEITHGRFMSMVSSLLQCENVDRLNYCGFRGQRVATLVPLTIAVGLFHNLGANFCFDYSFVLRRHSKPLSVEMLDDLMVQANITGMVTAPPVLVDLLENPAVLERFEKNVKTVIYAGAPLPARAGDRLSKMVQLSSAYGSTETGVYPVYANDPEDWQYYEFDPVFGSALQPWGELGYHEIVIPRSRDIHGPFQSVFDLKPDEKEWHTDDIFLRHDDPQKRNFWRYAGRSDDFIEDESERSQGKDPKARAFLPNEMETLINDNDKISGAVICENRGGNIAVLIEPKSVKEGEGDVLDAKAEKNLIESLWSRIEKANEACLTEARIKKELVIVVGKPLPRGTKGYPQRGKSRDDNRAAIDAAYATTQGKPKLTREKMRFGDQVGKSFRRYLGSISKAYSSLRRR